MFSELVQFTPDYKSLVVELKKIRRHNKLRNSELAEMFDLSDTQIADTEIYGKDAITYEKLDEIVRYLKGDISKTVTENESAGYYLDKKLLSKDMTVKFKESNESMVALAKRCGISDNTLALIMNDTYKSTPRKETIEKICRTMELPVNKYLKKPKITFSNKFENGNSFGEAFKKLREDRNLTQNVLADKAQCHFTTISKIENGRTDIEKMSSERIQKLSDVLHYDIRNLVPKKEEQSVVQQKKKEDREEIIKVFGDVNNTPLKHLEVSTPKILPKQDWTIAVNSDRLSDNNYNKLMSLLQTINLMSQTDVEFDLSYSIRVK